MVLHEPPTNDSPGCVEPNDVQVVHVKKPITIKYPGKVKHFSHYYKFVLEPVEQWREAGLLKALYTGEVQSLAFQLIALASRKGLLDEAKKDPKNRLVVTERSYLSDKGVFAKLNLDEMNFKWYDLAYQNLMELNRSNVEIVVIYLDVPLDGLKDRIKKRNRPEEQDLMNGDYLSNLSQAHEDWFSSLESEKYRVDASLSEDIVKEEVLKLVSDLYLRAIQNVDAVMHVTIEGSIGAGKSEVLKHLMESY